jgi:hypothetical protein
MAAYIVQISVLGENIFNLVALILEGNSHKDGGVPMSDELSE